MTREDIAFAIISGLLVNEATDICPWVAVRLVQWAARRRYPHDPKRAAIRAVEHARVINDRPGKLFKLFTALGFALHALVVLRRDRKHVGMTGWRAAAKRTIDVGIATVALVVSLPLWLVIALAIRLTSPGPVFFYQERVTKGGRIFRMYKFRTMRTTGGVAADATMPFYSINVDPRLTRVGRFLHRVSLDELPQFWNVLKGDMSIVGPRPLPVAQVDTHRELLAPRLQVPAGVTGWWQINGRSMLSPEAALAVDRFYIENWSLGLDLFILAKTFGVALRRQGGDMTAIEDRHARFLTSIRPRLDDLAPVKVGEHGRGFWVVLDPPRDGAESRVGFLPEGPGLAALESQELAEMTAELLTRYDPAYRPPPDQPGPFDPARDHLLVIFEGGCAYLYRLDGTPNETRPLLTVVPLGHGA